MQSREYTLAELADAAAMTERNVRAYASRGLLPLPRRLGRRTVYGPEHVARLRLVRALHRHGLALRVITDLVERGTADAELARLGRENLPAVPGTTRVPLSVAVVEGYQRAHPDGMQALVDARLVDRDGDRYVASATTLGLVAALAARGVDVADCAEVSLRAAQAATRSAPGVGAVLDGVVDGAACAREELTVLAVQLAASAYADVLVARLSPRGP